MTNPTIPVSVDYYEQYLSIAIGPNAGTSFMPGTQATVALGYKALNMADESCSATTAIGSKALSQCVGPTNSEAIGNGAMAATTYTDRCTCIGDGAGKWAGCDMPVSNNHDYFHANVTSGTPPVTTNTFDDWTQYDPCARDCVGPMGWNDPTPVAPTTENAYKTGTIPGGPSDNYLNVYIGRDTGNHNVKGTCNTFVGGHCAHGWNVSRSTYIGANAGNRALVSSDCVGIGYNCLYANVRGTCNTAGGVQSMESNVFGENNTAWGYKTLNRLTGYSPGSPPEINPVTAYDSDAAREQAKNNLAIGYFALTALVWGTGNTVLGANAALALENGDDNTAVGHSALGALTAGSGNTALGANTLGALTGAAESDDNTAVGRDALASLVTGQSNTAVGSKALTSLEGSMAGSDNTAVGANALTSLSGNMAGNDNTALGSQALGELNNGNGNTALGSGALGLLAHDDDNTAVGNNSLAALTQGNGNTAIGNAALTALTGTNPTANNTAVGDSALVALGSGTANTAVGEGALLYLLSGDNNTAVGRWAGRYTSTSGSPGHLTGYSNVTCLGYNSIANGSDQVQLGNSSTTTYVYGTVQNRSDLRDKADVRDTALGLEFVEALRPVDFRYDYREDYVDGDGTAHPKDGSRTRTRFHHGLIAQEVKAAMDALGVDFGGYQDHTVTGGGDVLTLGYDELIGPLIRGVQELSGTVRELTARIAELEQERGNPCNVDERVPSLDVQPDVMVSLAGSATTHAPPMILGKCGDLAIDGSLRVGGGAAGGAMVRLALRRRGAAGRVLRPEREHRLRGGRGLDAPGRV